MALSKSYGIAQGWPLGSGQPGALTTLARRYRVLTIGDSQTAGRGTGTGSVGMDGARVLSWPTRMRDAIITYRVPSTSESWAEAHNPTGDFELYDPRMTLGTWAASDASVPPTGTGLGGSLMTKNVTTGTSLRFLPSIPVDTFEVWCPRNNYGDMNYNLNGGSSTIISQTGALTFLKTTVTTTLGLNQIRLQPAAAVRVYANTTVAYNSAVNDVTVINMAARGWSTTEWTYNDVPWRPFPGIAFMIGSGDIGIVALGINDLQNTATNPNTYAAWYANMQTIINQILSVGAYPILAVPMPIDPAKYGTFTYPELVTGYIALAALYNCPLYRGDLALGSWADGNAAGQTYDNLHWKIPASVTYGNGIAPLVLRQLGLIV